MPRAIQLCVVVCLISSHLTGSVLAKMVWSPTRPVPVLPRYPHHRTDFSKFNIRENSGNRESLGYCQPKHFECMPGECIPSPWVCDGIEDCTNGLDEKACHSNLKYFKKIEKYRLKGHDVEKWQYTSLKSCARRCKGANFTCKSFSHKTEGNECLLSDKDVGATGDLLYDADFDYYEMIERSTNCSGMFRCGNRKCINRSEVCDGKNNCGDRTDEKFCFFKNEDIRLVGSNNSYEGRVEVKVQSRWRQVCDNGFRMSDANVVCKELGFDLGALKIQPRGYYKNLDPPDVFMVDRLNCRGNETSLRKCNYDKWSIHICMPKEVVGVVCKTAVNMCTLQEWKCDSSPTCIPITFLCDAIDDCPDGSDESSTHCETPFALRLTNGSSPLEGRVEVRHHGVWGTVCDDNFSEAAAKVICRSLGYGGSAIAKKNGFFGPGVGPIWLDEVSCNGSEVRLSQCRHNYWGQHDCNHDEDASVICTEGIVVDSEDCTNGLDKKACSSYLRFFKKTEKYRLEGHDVEKRQNTSLEICAQRCKEADFTCKSFSHKIEGNKCLLSDTDGRETEDLNYNADFDYYEMIDRSTNCDGMFVCGNNKCVNQSEVCDGKNNCGDRTDENNCTVQNFDYEIRLAGSNSSHEGRVEVKVLGHWGQVCDDKFGLIEGGVVCKELGFDLGVLEVRPGGYNGNLDPSNVFKAAQLNCRGNETSLRECDFHRWGVDSCLPEKAVGIVCKTECTLQEWKCKNSRTCIKIIFICDAVVDCPDGSDERSTHCDTPFELRLNGSTPLEGRVEVRHHGIWGTVCDDNFSPAAAKMVCRSLGYNGSATVKKNGFFGPGDGPIWLDEVFCKGRELQLSQCRGKYWGDHDCTHDEDVGVICTNDTIVDSESTPSLISETSISGWLPSNCGNRYEEVYEPIMIKVVRGLEAPKKSYPWQASIRKRSTRSSHLCGASIITSRHVLTAAHCLKKYIKGFYFVRAGEYNSKIDEGTEIDLDIEDYYIHEDYHKNKSLNNDIALVLLKGPGIDFDENIMPICLPTADAKYSVGLECTISGFGSMRTSGYGESHELRYGWIPLINQTKCQSEKIYGKTRITDGMVCAGRLDDSKTIVDACQGDSGGPLACPINGVFHLYGLTSWGFECGRVNKPGVYVRVAHYRDWIIRKIRESMLQT